MLHNQDDPDKLPATNDKDGVVDNKQQSAYDILEQRRTAPVTSSSAPPESSHEPPPPETSLNQPPVQPAVPQAEPPVVPVSPFPAANDAGFFGRINNWFVATGRQWGGWISAVALRFWVWCVKVACKIAALLGISKLHAMVQQRHEKKVRTPVVEYVSQRELPPKPPINIKIASFFHHWGDSIKKMFPPPKPRDGRRKKDRRANNPVTDQSTVTNALQIGQTAPGEPSSEDRKAYLESILSRNLAQRITERLPFSTKEEKRAKMLKELEGDTTSEIKSEQQTGFARPKGPVVLMVLDGYGIGPHDKGNAIFQTEPGFVSELAERFPFIPIEAAGPAVGLPAGQIGNSEVGHMHIGAGRIVLTGLSLINEEVRLGRVASNPALVAAIAHAKQGGKKFHVAGLLSPGGVHSHQDQIFALIRAIAAQGVQPVVHVFCDGRDVAQKSVKGDLQALLAVCAATNAVIGTISGRYYAMDRDHNFERTMQAYDVMTGNGETSFDDPLAYVEQAYAKGVTDEFIAPAYNRTLADPFVRDGDSFFFANYRPDRARQLSHLFINSNLYKFQPPHRPHDLFFVTMAQYDGITPSAVAYPPVYPEHTLGQIIADAGLSQLRIAETEKYAHVTFFLDGGREVTYPKMDKLLIPSPKVATYDLQPEMSAVEVTDQLLAVIDKYDFVVINYANPDMVGHTGVLAAAEQAVRVVDQQVRRVYDKVAQLHGTIFLLADHGNAEVMIDKDGNPQTAHTTNPVPFIITDPRAKFVVSTGSLANVAPTVLKYMGIKIPAAMTSAPLI